MKLTNTDNTQIREKIKKGLDLTFKKLLKTKLQADGVFVLSEKGIIRKVRASELSE